MDTLADLRSINDSACPAVLFDDDVLTFPDLEARSNQVADALVAAACDRAKWSAKLTGVPKQTSEATLDGPRIVAHGIRSSYEAARIVSS